MLDMLLDFLAVLVIAFAVWVVCYALIRAAFKAVEVYRRAKEWACPRPHPYRVIWDSPAGSPPTWLSWKPWGTRSFTTMVLATDADSAIAAIEAAYEQAHATGYPDSYAPIIVRCQKVVTPLGGD